MKSCKVANSGFKNTRIDMDGTCGDAVRRVLPISTCPAQPHVLGEVGH